jgi:Domain of unknown function (DUF6795)
MGEARNLRPARLVGLALLGLAAAGCGGRYTPVSVSGVVTLNGEPVEGATVYFYATGDEMDGRPAFGTTDKEGRFRLSTMGNEDGALRREYKVVIHKYVPTLPNLKIPEFPDTPEGQADRQDFMYKHFEAKGIPPFKNALPVKYGDSKTTPLTCNVTGKTTVEFDLTDN